MDVDPNDNDRTPSSSSSGYNLRRRRHFEDEQRVMRDAPVRRRNRANVNPEPDAATPQLRQDVLDRIFAPTAATATREWMVADYNLAMPPLRSDEDGREDDYSLQDLVGPNPVTWEWLTRNVTLFYQTNDFAGGGGRRYYLRAKSYPIGVPQSDWSLLFPGQRVRATTFRTFELIDVTDQHRFLPYNHIDRTVYFDVDLASRAPDGVISIPVGEGDVLEEVGREVLEYVDSLLDLASGVPLTVNTQLLAVFCSILITIVVNVASNRLYNNPYVSIVLTYEVHRNNEAQSALMSKGTRFEPMPGMSRRDNLLDLAMRVVHLVWLIRRSVMQERYEEEDAFVFHPRSVRVLLASLPTTDGDLFVGPPRDLLMPRGGCLSYNDMPLQLAELLEGYIVSHDVLAPGVAFDNNCGIRESLISLGIVKCDKETNVRQLFLTAAEMRADTPVVPPFIRLTPQELLYVVISQIDPNISFRVWELPTPDKPRGFLYHWDPEEEDATSAYPHPLLLVLSHGHYFSLRTHGCELSLREMESAFKYVTEIRYCRRCCRYCHSQTSRVSHDYEEPSLMYPPCKEKVERVNVLQPEVDVINLDDSHRTLPTVKSVPPFVVTPLRRIGFMDLETWRPLEKSGYHEVYAVGWIRYASPTVEPTDVKLYSSLGDPTTTNSALVLAFADVITHVMSNPRYTKKKPYYLYLYNGSGFDNLFILHTLATECRLKPDSMTLKDGQLFTMSYLDGALVIRDLYLFTGCSLAKACKMYHIEDRLAKGSFDHNSITSLRVVEERWAEISDYLQHDLTALNYVFIAFRQSCYETTHLDMCTRITKSHLAYDYWNSTLTDLQRSQVTLPNSFDEYQDLLLSYYGGRVYPTVKDWVSSQWHEPYELMNDYADPLDVVSLYPSRMWMSEEISKRYYPYTKRDTPLYFCGTPRFVHEIDDEDYALVSKLLFKDGDYLRVGKNTPSMDYWRCMSECIASRFLNHKGAIVCVDYEPNRNLMLPLLPHKNSKGDTAWDLLPHNKQWYVLEEILDAKFYGYTVTKFHCAYIYPHRSALFDSAMSTLMRGKSKCERGDPKRDLYKIWANATYGKHAQKAITEDTRIIYPHELDELLEKEYVISMEPICNEQVSPALQLLKKNRPVWVNDDAVAAEEIEQLLDEEYEIPVEAFVVKTKPRSTLPSKPTYLGAQVTAYSRIHMNWLCYRMDLLDNCDDVKRQMFYTDTDSLVVHHSATIGDDRSGIFGKGVGMLDDELQGGRIVEFVSLAPKTYAMTYKMPDNSLWMKIRCKGFPHTKSDLKYGEGELKDVSSYMTDGSFDAKKIDLGQYVYRLTDLNDQTSYYRNLSPDIFRKILYRQVSSLTVFFTSMRRCYFGLNALGHISGVKHCYMERSLKSATWWDGSEERPEPHRKSHPDRDPRLSFPIGHAALDDQ